VLSEPDPRASLRYYQRLIEGGQYRSEAALHYGLALAQGAVGDHAAARHELDALIAREGEHPMLLSARAHNELEAGNLAGATRLYREALKVYPGNSALTLQYAEALIRAGDAEKARDLLRSHSREHPEEPEVFRLLARAHAELGEQARAYQAQAEYYFLSGDVLGALQQLKVARQKAGNDFYTASSVEARLAELEKIAKEEKEDRRDREP
jgi:predicted Zn-dependent protease